MSEPEPRKSSARVLATRLARLLSQYLAGTVDHEGVAEECIRIAKWIEKGSKAKRGKKRDADPADTQAVFDHWVKVTGRNPKMSKLTEGRKTKINARLLEGYSVKDIQRATTAIANSKFHQGDNDRGHRYDDITVICRNGEQVEKYRDLAPRSIVDEEHVDEREELRMLAAEALQRGDTDAYDEYNGRLAGIARRATD